MENRYSSPNTFVASAIHPRRTRNLVRDVLTTGVALLGAICATAQGLSQSVDPGLQFRREQERTDTTVSYTAEVYADITCATYLGLLVRNYSVSWSAGTVAGKTNVAKALITSTGYSIQRDGAAGYSLSRPPASGVVTKTLFYVDGSLMYLAARDGTLDADGYPTTLETTALYTR